MLRALGGGGSHPNVPLKNQGRFIFDDKEKAEVAASYWAEVFSNSKETKGALQERADRVRNRLLRDLTVVSQEDLPVVITDRVVSIIRGVRRGRALPGRMHFV